MVKFQLDDKWRVQTDVNNWVLEKSTGEGWRAFGYFGNIQALLRGITSAELRDSKTMKEIRGIEVRLHEMIDGLPAKLKKAAKEAQIKPVHLKRTL